MSFPKGTFACLLSFKGNNKYYSRNEVDFVIGS